jgi:hypothetical protein
MEIAVIGGTGLIGSQVVKILNASGHEAAPHSPSTGLDLLRGRGLPEALKGADVVVNLTNSRTFDDASIAFFQNCPRDRDPRLPLAAAVIFELFAVPLLAALQGGQPPDRVWQRVQIACDWTSSPDVEDWVPVSLSSAPAGPDAGCAALATPGRRGAGAISRLMRAHAW